MNIYTMAFILLCHIPYPVILRCYMDYLIHCAEDPRCPPDALLARAAAALAAAARYTASALQFSDTAGPTIWAEAYFGVEPRCCNIVVPFGCWCSVPCWWSWLTFTSCACTYILEHTPAQLCCACCYVKLNSFLVFYHLTEIVYIFC